MSSSRVLEVKYCGLRRVSMGPLWSPSLVASTLSLCCLTAVTDRPVTRGKRVAFDSKAKVGALVQRVRTFKKQKLAEEAEEEAREEQLALAHAVSSRQYAVVRRTGNVIGKMKTM
jgi:hypothetical protein